MIRTCVFNRKYTQYYSSELIDKNQQKLSSTFIYNAILSNTTTRKMCYGISETRLGPYIHILFKDGVHGSLSLFVLILLICNSLGSFLFDFGGQAS